jgi:plastocyanin
MRRRPVLAAIALGAALAAPAGAAAMGGDMPGGHGGDSATQPAAPAPVEVGMQGKVFRPGRVDVLVGDTVTWHNDDLVTHTVFSADPALDSGRLNPGATFRHTFDRQGIVSYHCTLHRFMFGEVRVFGLALEATTGSAAPGKPATFAGRAPAGVTAVVIERLDAAGVWQPVGAATPGADRTFTAQAPTAGPSLFRARSGDLLSPVVRVAARPRVRIAATRRGTRITVRASATPAQPGARVVLQHYVRDRFAFHTLGRARLDHASRVTFRIRSHHYERLRVVITRGVRGYGSGTSRTLAVPTHAMRAHGEHGGPMYH